VASDALRKKWEKPLKRSIAAKMARSLATSLVQKMHGAAQHFSHRCVGCEAVRKVLHHIAEVPGSGSQCKDFEGRWEIEMVVLRVAVSLARRYADHLKEEAYQEALMKMRPHCKGIIVYALWDWRAAHSEWKAAELKDRRKEREAMAKALTGPATHAAKLATAQADLAAGRIDEMQFAQIFVSATMAEQGIPASDSIPKLKTTSPKAKGVSFSPDTPRECATYSKDEYDRSASSEYMASRLTDSGSAEQVSEGAMLGKAIDIDAEEMSPTGEEQPGSPSVFDKLGSLFS